MFVRPNIIFFIPAIPLNKVWILITTFLILIFLGGCSQENTTPDEYIERAKEYQEKGQLQSAVIELKNAVALNPSSLEARWLLGTINLQLINGAAAEKELRKSLELGIDRQTAIPYLGEALFQQAKFEQLLDEIQTGEFVNKENRAKVSVLRGDTYRVLRDYDKAGKAYRNALLDVGAMPDALVGLISIALSQGDIPQAEELLGEFDNASISNPKLWVAKAAIASAKSQDQMAEAHLQKVLELDPNNTNSRIELARLLLIRGDIEAARTQLNEAQAKIKGHPEVTFLQAWIAFMEGNLDQADELLTKHRNISPDDRRALVLSGAVANALNKPEQANVFVEKVLSFDPDNTTALRIMAAANLATKESSEIIAMFRSKIGAIKDSKLLMLIGLAALQLGAPEEGLAHLANVKDATPELILIRDELLHQQENSENAQQEIQKLETELETSENALETGKQLFDLYIKTKDLNKALALSQRLSKLYPQHPLPNNLMGVALWYGGQLAAARQSFLQSLIIDPNFRSAALNLAQVILIDAKGQEAAQSELNKYLTADPDLLELRAEALLLSSRTQEALEKTRALIEIRPDYAPAHFLAARIHGSNKDAEKMQEALERTLQLDPNYMMAKVALVPILIEENRLDEADKMIQDISFHDRNSIQLPQLKGLLALKQDRFTDAANFFNEALSRAPTNRYNLVNLARAKSLAGDLEGSVKALESWLQKQPEDVTMWRELAIGYHQLGRLQDAQKAVEKIAGTQQENAELLANLARFSTQYAPSKALEYGEKAIELAPDSPEVANSVGLVFLEHSQTERALELLQQAVNKQPNNRAYQYSLAYAYAKSEKGAEARKLLQEMLASDEPFAERKAAEALLQELKE